MDINIITDLPAQVLKIVEDNIRINRSSFSNEDLAKFLCNLYFMRTKNHIALVNTVASLMEPAFIRVGFNHEDYDQFLTQVKQHDADKMFNKPETIAYQVLGSVSKYSKASDFYRATQFAQLTYSQDVTIEHVRQNLHHPESWGTTPRNGIGKPISLLMSRLQGMSIANNFQRIRTDAQAFSILAEMVCDWSAVGIELRNGTAKSWFLKWYGKEWVADEQIREWIDLLVDVAEQVTQDKEFILPYDYSTLNWPSVVEVEKPVETKAIEAEVEKFETVTVTECSLEDINRKVASNIKNNLVYHCSSKKLDILKGSKTGAWSGEQGNVFVTPLKGIAACFIINKADILTALEKQLGKRVTKCNFGYDVWNWSNDKLQNIPKQVTVMLNIRGFKPFKGQSTGYLYTIDFSQYKDKCHMFNKNTNSDVEFLIEGDVKPIKVEEITVNWECVSSEEEIKRKGEGSVENMKFSNDYEPPYNAEQMLQAGYSKEFVEKLSKDPVHSWRMKTGIELIHIEPSRTEFMRIWHNWNLMSIGMKNKSDDKAKELFHCTNLVLYAFLLPQYTTETPDHSTLRYPTDQEIHDLMNNRSKINDALFSYEQWKLITDDEDFIPDSEEELSYDDEASMEGSTWFGRQWLFHVSDRNVNSLHLEPRKEQEGGPEHICFSTSITKCLYSATQSKADKVYVYGLDLSTWTPQERSQFVRRPSRNDSDFYYTNEMWILKPVDIPQLFEIDPKGGDSNLSTSERTHDIWSSDGSDGNVKRVDSQYVIPNPNGRGYIDSRTGDRVYATQRPGFTKWRITHISATPKMLGAALYAKLKLMMMNAKWADEKRKLEMMKDSKENLQDEMQSSNEAIALTCNVSGGTLLMDVLDHTHTTEEFDIIHQCTNESAKASGDDLWSLSELKKQYTSPGKEYREHCIFYLSDIPVGAAMIMNPDDKVKCFSIGDFAILPDFRGRGYGEAALCMLITFLKNKDNSLPIYLGVSVKNEAAISLYKKLGFKILKTDKTKDDPSKSYHQMCLGTPIKESSKEDLAVFDIQDDLTDEEISNESLFGNLIKYFSEETIKSPVGKWLFSFLGKQKDQLAIDDIDPSKLNKKIIQTFFNHEEDCKNLLDWVTVPDYDLLPKLVGFGRFIDELYGFKRSITVYRGIRSGFSMKHNQETMGLIDNSTYDKTLMSYAKKGYKFNFKNTGPMSVARSPWIAKIYGNVISKTKLDANADKLVITAELAYVLQRLQKTKYPQYRPINMSCMMEIVVFPGKTMKWEVITTSGDISSELPSIYLKEANEELQEIQDEADSMEKLKEMPLFKLTSKDEDLMKDKRYVRLLFMVKHVCKVDEYITPDSTFKDLGVTAEAYKSLHDHIFKNFYLGSIKELPKFNESTKFKEFARYIINHLKKIPAELLGTDPTKVESSKEDFFNFFGDILKKSKSSNTTFVSDTKIKTISGIDEGRLYYHLENFPYHLFLRRAKQMYKTTRLSNLLQRIGSRNVSIHKFFIPELLYLLEVLKFPTSLIESIRQKTWVGQVADKIRTDVDMSLINQNMTCQLYDHQSSFISEYARLKDTNMLRGYLLSFEQGLGKTITSLALMEALGKEKVIIICPKNTMQETWLAHIQKFYKTPQKTYLAYGETPSDDTRFFIMNYEAIGKLDLSWFKNKKTGIIVDESHNFLRMTSDRTANLIQLAKTIPASDLDILPQSGTPVKCAGSELIPMLFILDPLFDATALEIFKETFGFNMKIAVDVLHHRLERVMTRVTKDILNLPEKHETTLMIKMPTAQQYTVRVVQQKIQEYIQDRKEYHLAHMKEYDKDFDTCVKYLETLPISKSAEYAEWKDAINKLRSSNFKGSGGYLFEKGYLARINMYENDVLIPALPLDLRKKFKNSRAAVKYLYLKIRGEVLGGLLVQLRQKMTSEMMEAAHVETIVEEAVKKTVIFTSYVDTIELTEKYFQNKGMNPLPIYGKNASELTENIQKFQVNPAINPLIASLKMLSTGATLTAANTVIFLNKPWRSIEYDQASDRVHRIGQDTDVNIVSLVLDTGGEGNLSTRMEEIMDFSSSMFEGIVDGSPVSMEELDEGMQDYLKSLEVSDPNSSMEQMSDDTIKQKKASILTKLCKICDTIDPSGANTARYRNLIEQMSPKDFDSFMMKLKNKEWQLDLITPNMKNDITNENLLKAADMINCQLMHRLWMRDDATGRTYLTDNEYMVLILPIRRQQQFLDEKMSVPENDQKIDAMSGQVTGDDESCSFTNPEIQILAARGLDRTLEEMVNIRGGNIEGYANFRQSLEETGEASLDAISPNARPRITKVAEVLLQSMMIDNNITGS